MKLVGKVTEDERDEIKKIYMRKLSLIDLVKSLNEDDSVYEKVLTDLSETNENYNKWWDKISSKYLWEGKGSSGNWSIDFNSCEISLIED